MADPGEMAASQVILIGCCGAYCGTCPALNDASCNGCKLGYDTGKRDPEKVRCAIKRCCFLERRLDTCADCSNFENCRILQGFFAKNGYKYRKYRESLEFIRQRGYPALIEAARSWKRAYGSLTPPKK